MVGVGACGVGRRGISRRGTTREVPLLIRVHLVAGRALIHNSFHLEEHGQSGVLNWLTNSHTINSNDRE